MGTDLPYTNNGRHVNGTNLYLKRLGIEWRGLDSTGSGQKKWSSPYKRKVSHKMRIIS